MEMIHEQNFLIKALCAVVKNKEACRKRYREHKKEYITRAKLWTKINPEKSKEIKTKWAENNHDKVLASGRKSRYKDLEKSREFTRRWARNNPDKLHAKRQRGRAIKSKAKGNFTAKEFRDLKQAYNNCCLRCGRNEEELKTLGLVLSPDHVVPLSKGGTNYIFNIQPLCHSRKRGSSGGCNNSKGTKDTDYRTTWS